MNRIRENDFFKFLIGIMLIVPFYPVATLISNLGLIEYNKYLILITTLLYLPMIVGIICLYTVYKEKINKPLSICPLIFLCLSIFHFRNANFVEHESLNETGHFWLFIITTTIYRILICFLYNKKFGKKKTIILVITYLLTMLFWFYLIITHKNVRFY